MLSRRITPPKWTLEENAYSSIKYALPTLRNLQAVLARSHRKRRVTEQKTDLLPHKKQRKRVTPVRHTPRAPVTAVATCQNPQVDLFYSQASVDVFESGRDFHDFFVPAFWFSNWTVCDYSFWIIL